MVQRAPLNNRLLSPCYFYTWTTCYFYRYFYTILVILFMSFPGGSVGKESTCNAGDLGSIPGFGKIPWRRERLPTPVFWPGEFHGLYSPWGRKQSDTTKRP